MVQVRKALAEERCFNEAFEGYRKWIEERARHTVKSWRKLRVSYYGPYWWWYRVKREKRDS